MKGFVQPFGGKMPPATLWLLLALVGIFVAWAFADAPNWVVEYLALSGGALRRGAVWTLATSLVIHLDARALLADGLALWAFGGPLERFWGRARYLRFLAATGLLANVAVGLFALIGVEGAIGGIGASTVALVIAWSFAMGQTLVRLLGATMRASYLAYLFVGMMILGALMGGRWLDVLHLAAGAAIAWFLQGGDGLDRLRRRLRRSRLSLVSTPRKRNGDPRMVN